MTDRTANSQATLNSALDASVAGDDIIMDDDTYIDLIIDMGRTGAGTQTNPITLRAQTPVTTSAFGVKFTGNSTHLEVSGPWKVIEGFLWDTILPTDTSSNGIIFDFVGALDCKFRRNRFNAVGVNGTSIGPSSFKLGSSSTASKRNIIEQNEFNDVRNPIWEITVEGQTQISSDNIFRWNYFHDSPSQKHLIMPGRTVRSAAGEVVDVDLATIIESNLCEDMTQRDFVHNKSSGTQVRYNTIRRFARNENESITLRGGARNNVHHNFFIDSSGIRMLGGGTGAGNAVENNFMSHTGTGTAEGITLEWGNSIYPTEISNAARYPPLLARIVNNTVINFPDRGINCQLNANVDLGQGAGVSDLQPEGSLVRNNIVENNKGTGYLHASWTIDKTIENNIVNPSGTGTAGDAHAGINNANPNLLTDGEVERLQASSAAAIDAGTADAAITLDMDFTTITGSLDIGADEYFTTVPLRRMAPLVAADVGLSVIEAPTISAMSDTTPDDGQTGVTITTVGAGNWPWVAGAVEINTKSDGSGTSVAQTITAYTDTLVTITVVAGGLEGDNFLILTNMQGFKTAGFAVNLPQAGGGGANYTPGNRLLYG